jgi:DNA polymerase-1
MRVALIDADVVAFQSAVVNEKAIDWGEGVWTQHAHEEDVIRSFRASVNSIQEAVGADKVILAFSDKTNWRKDVLPSYKANRANTRQPMLRKFITEWAKENYESFTRDTLEGDDVLGILATRKSQDEMIICTIDKDMKTIPGQHYNFGKKEVFEVTEEEADYWHLYQTLVGDATDNYAGCPGVGPVAAKKVLDKDPSWAGVVKAFDKAGLGEEEALTQARVARICRASDYDFKTKQVKLWSPNTK